MFKYLVFISALGVALAAAFFSVTGIATLFSGKFWSVLLMASALEIGKLVAVSFLYRYWKQTAGLLKTYLVAGVVVLMVITSIGIYGYLSSAYAEIAAGPQNIMNQITSVENRQQTIDDDIARLRINNETIDSRQQQSQTTLDNILAGETGLSERSAFLNLRTEIADLDDDRQVNAGRIQAAQSERDSLEAVRLQSNADLNTSSEVGTFVYIARTLNVPLDTIVKWFVLVIVFVFDPLAVALILAYNSIIINERDGVELAGAGGPSEKFLSNTLKKLTKNTKKTKIEPVVEPETQSDEPLEIRTLDKTAAPNEPVIRYSRQGKDPNYS